MYRYYESKIINIKKLQKELIFNIKEHIKKKCYIFQKSFYKGVQYTIQCAGQTDFLF